MLLRFDKDKKYEQLKRMIGKTVRIRSYNIERRGKIVGIHSEFFVIIGLLSYIVEFPGGSREIMFPNEIPAIGENSNNQWQKRTSNN